jgi:hypothetical protein
MYVFQYGIQSHFHINKVKTKNVNIRGKNMGNKNTVQEKMRLFLKKSSKYDVAI